LEGHNVAVFRVLGMKASNIKMASERRTILHSDRLSVFKLRARKKHAWKKHARKKHARKKTSVLSPAIVTLAVEWWMDETRISPISKDTVQDHVGRNEYNHHPMHLLQETLVMSSYHQ
jgi:hypothetical protein